MGEFKVNNFCGKLKGKNWKNSELLNMKIRGKLLSLKGFLCYFSYSIDRKF